MVIISVFRYVSGEQGVLKTYKNYYKKYKNICFTPFWISLRSFARKFSLNLQKIFIKIDNDCYINFCHCLILLSTINCRSRQEFEGL